MRRLNAMHLKSAPPAAVGRLHLPLEEDYGRNEAAEEEEESDDRDNEPNPERHPFVRL